MKKLIAIFGVLAALSVGSNANGQAIHSSQIVNGNLVSSAKGGASVSVGPTFFDAWTPTMNEGSNAMDTGVGYWSKTGRMVTVTASFTNMTKSGTGNLSIPNVPGGAPLTSTACAIEYAVITFSAGEIIAARLTTTGTIFLTVLTSASNAANVTASDLHATNSDVYVTCVFGTYE